MGWRTRDLPFLPSELATIGFVLWGASRFYFASAFPASIWLGGFLAWILIVLGPSFVGPRAQGNRGPAWRAVRACVGVAAVALLARAISGQLSWRQGAAIAIVLGAALALNRWLLSVAAGRGDIGWGEGFRWAALQALAAYAVHPYVRCALVGAGDAYQYALSMSDFVRQTRAGVFPVFVGQSEFAFNGSVHTLRNAPYFVHLGALLDSLTLHTLPPFAMANLAIVFSGALGVVGTYAALLVYSPGRAATASALAALYILSPGILAPLYNGDMVTAFMTVPMIPWWVAGLAQAADEPSAWRPWLMQGAALAALWCAHPPVALWATVLSAAAWVLIVARGRDLRSGIESITVTALLCALLAGYEFASVLSLGLPPWPDLRSTTAAVVFGNIERGWKAGLVPMDARGSLPGHIALCYPLIAAAAAGLFAIGTRKSTRVLLLCMACVLILLVPVPGISARLWSLVPHAVFDVADAWPMQRFYPLLAALGALAAFAAMSAAPLLDAISERRAAVVAMAVAAGVVWSLSEARAPVARGASASLGEERSSLLFRPENIALTRGSYLLFGFYPSYFSNSPMDPVLETRLVDPRTMEVIADGSAVASGARAPGSFEVELRETSGGQIEPEIPIGPGQASVLRFDFHGRDPEGVLSIRDRSVFREYRLPQSGEERSFGSGPENGHAIAVRNPGATADSISLAFLPDAAPGPAQAGPRLFAHVSVEPLATSEHVIELRSLLPFHAIVKVDRPAVLETPKVFMPGYRARVNGRSAEIVRTGAGLVGVSLDAGRCDVVVDYPGNALLRWSYGISAVGWISVAFCAVGLPVADPSGSWRRRSLAPGAGIRRAVRLLPFVVFALVTVPLVVLFAGARPAPQRDGALRMVVRLPVGAAQVSEPLLTTGRTGAGDVIYIKYLGHDRVVVGHDCWGIGGAVSKPLVVDFLAPQFVEIAMRSLSRRAPSRSGTPDAGQTGVSVRWNGHEILSDDRDSFPPAQEAPEIGRNMIGASTCVPAFSGAILDYEPIEPWKR